MLFKRLLLILVALLLIFVVRINRQALYAQNLSPVYDYNTARTFRPDIKASEIIASKKDTDTGSKKQLSENYSGFRFQLSNPKNIQLPVSKGSTTINDTHETKINKPTDQSCLDLSEKIDQPEVRQHKKDKKKKKKKKKTKKKKKKKKKKEKEKRKRKKRKEK